MAKNGLKKILVGRRVMEFFSYSHSHIDKVINYVFNQEIHHQKKTFKQEYHQLLEKFEVSFEERFLFDFIE